MNAENKRVCPVERAGGLDNPIRKLLQNPQKILKPFIKKGMTVLDLGCGPGFFSIEIAKLLSGAGRVISADLQDGMLDKLRLKIKGTDLEQNIVLHKCEQNSIGLTTKVDFVLAFYMVHEVPSQESLFKELLSNLNPKGQVFIIEPKFHVSKKAFEIMVESAKKLGFEPIGSPSVFFSRTVILAKKA